MEEERDKILKRILKTYSYFYLFFEWLSTNIILIIIFKFFNILNEFTSCLILIITILSHVAIEFVKTDK